MQTRNNRMRTKLLGVTLSLSMAFSGAMLLAPSTTHAAAAEASAADAIIATGKQYLGVPYKFGASSGSTDAFDCSSFMQYIFKKNGIDLPRSSKQQAAVGTPVAKDQLQPGDLVFSDTNRDGIINHVSLYIGDGKLLHTYRVGIGVTVSTFAGSTWDNTFVTARHVIPGDSGTVALPQSDETASISANTGKSAESATPATAESKKRSKWNPSRHS
ncbi:MULTISPECIES: C40 family peptidase [unclassified Paenibacillus]|uniref:C40 family peptidase n=1 Tax=unclassified Paenibacillus TaxID=185978 RepID=UPI000956D425|nr:MULTISPECIES: C40 family peptidase [unclassified Paenibacillus]ASS65409.1 C40 family peptidase [Paenibacillus sp. RUD330]SIQ37228.1 Cell wall-associated hydrolase, NlpC family [Paenibacillus sp. RU4X]SIQ59296.1 Cell wall-associated hydrolase, NlpC family [Paenibacillus sp. RU4T]